MAHDTHGHGFAHPAPLPILFATFVALCILTVLTMLLAGNLGPFGFAVAMVLATVKATLVLAFFMHAIWDKPFNVFAFLGSTLFMLLFIFMTLTDTGHYQDQIDVFPRAAETTTE